MISKLVVVAFMRTECPLAGLYAPRLAELARTYEKKGVAFFGVDSDRPGRSIGDGPVCHGARAGVSILEGCRQ